MTFPFFFFNDTATTEIYTLSLHDALPIWSSASTRSCSPWSRNFIQPKAATHTQTTITAKKPRSEEHTSELQSQSNLVCRLLLEKKKKMQVRYSLLEFRPLSIPM